MEDNNQRIIHFGIENLKSSKTANLEKWGKDREYNVLLSETQWGAKIWSII